MNKKRSHQLRSQGRKRRNVVTRAFNAIENTLRSPSELVWLLGAWGSNGNDINHMGATHDAAWKGTVEAVLRIWRHAGRHKVKANFVGQARGHRLKVYTDSDDDRGHTFASENCVYNPT